MYLCELIFIIRSDFTSVISTYKPGLHEQIKEPEFAQILDSYEVTLTEIAQIKRVLFAHVNAAIRIMV